MAGRGRFIVFEGLDGCGKTTQLFSLKSKLLEYGIKCRDEREPSDGIIGLLTRGAVKKKMTFQPETLAHLFAADRYEHVVNDILPELERGVHVLCDRFVFSNMAFQGLSMPIEKVLTYNRCTLDALMPDMTIFIEVPPDICLQRLKSERTHLELYEGGEESNVIHENFMRSFEMLPEANVKLINGDKRAGVVFDKVWDAVKELFDLEG